MICERSSNLWSAVGTALLGLVLLPLWVVGLLLVALVVWIEEMLNTPSRDNSRELYPTLSKLHPGCFNEPQNLFEHRTEKEPPVA